jgi:hypothetical protein
VKTQQYRYGPLDEKRRDIRLMALLAGSASNPIAITLGKRHFRLMAAGRSQPTKLSRMHGARKRTPLTIIIGSDDSKPGFLLVAQNPAEALPEHAGSMQSVSTNPI